MANKQLLQSAGDGTAIPAGYVGEVVSGSLSAVTATFSGGNPGINTMGSVANLTAGVWLIFAEDSMYNNARPPSATVAASGSDLYDGTSVIANGAQSAIWKPTSTAGDVEQFRCNHVVTYTVASGQTKTISFRLRCDANAGTPNGASVTNRAYGYIRAVRIA